MHRRGFPRLDDPNGLERDATKARRFGFTAKSAFKSRQVEAINRNVPRRQDEITYVQRVVDAFRAAETRGDASVAVAGKPVDRPIVMRVYRLLEQVETMNEETAE